MVLASAQMPEDWDLKERETVGRWACLLRDFQHFLTTPPSIRYHDGNLHKWTPPKKKAQTDLKRIARLGLSDLPICMAKTPASLSDDPSLLGRPEGFEITVREIQVAAGAGFLVPITGDIMRMPGLPKVPGAVGMHIGDDGEIVGLS